MRSWSPAAASTPTRSWSANQMNHRPAPPTPFYIFAQQPAAPSHPSFGFGRQPPTPSPPPSVLSFEVKAETRWGDTVVLVGASSIGKSNKGLWFCTVVAAAHAPQAAALSPVSCVQAATTCVQAATPRKPGSTESFGGWQPERGQRLHTEAASYPLWRLAGLSVPADLAGLEYKLVILRAGGDVEWEPALRNRRVPLGGGESV